MPHYAAGGASASFSGAGTFVFPPGGHRCRGVGHGSSPEAVTYPAGALLLAADSILRLLPSEGETGS